VDKLVEFLRQEQFHVAGIHSGKNQAYRFRVMNAFRNGWYYSVLALHNIHLLVLGLCDVLVASDLVSRGMRAKMNVQAEFLNNLFSFL
jgi:ATP-dependent RNA helicase DDX41